MKQKKKKEILDFLTSSSAYKIPKVKEEKKNVKVSKTLYPYLIGRQKLDYFYDLETSLTGIQATLAILKRFFEKRQRVLFINASPFFKKVLDKKPLIRCVKWKQNVLRKSPFAYLVFVNKVNKEILTEMSKYSRIPICLGSPTLNKMPYPFTINVNSVGTELWLLQMILSIYPKAKDVKKRRPKFRSLRKKTSRFRKP